MDFSCRECAAPLRVGGRGRPRKYCSDACRKRYTRSRELPVGMTSGRRWVRAAGKRPLTADGRSASSTDARAWCTRSEAKDSPAGNGMGVMLGSGLGCYDLDHVTDTEARRFIAAIPEPVIYAERSMSGKGVHVFVETPEGPGSVRVIDGVSVERYSRARFIRVTGERFIP